MISTNIISLCIMEFDKNVSMAAKKHYISPIPFASAFGEI